MITLAVVLVDSLGQSTATMPLDVVLASLGGTVK